MTINSLYAVAAFISAGMHRDVIKLDEARDDADTGCYELVATAVAYTDFAQSLADTGFRLIGDFPGIYEYEVCEEFGLWYVGETSRCKFIPRVSTACDKLRNLAFAYFAGSGLPDELAHQLNVALANVAEPPQPEI